MKFEEGQLFAVTRGDLRGSNILIVEREGDNVHTLDLPDMKNIIIPESEMRFGVENDILELLEMIPSDILNICKRQYEKNINSR